MPDPSELPPPSASVATPSAFAVAATSILPPPEVMAALIWHSWHYGPAPAEDKPPPKIPDPIPGGAATTVDGLLAADYSAAYDYAIALGAAKIGAVVGGSLPNGHVPIGVDLDDCRNRETGEITAWAQDPLVSFDSYTEVSPSGKGVKIFAVIAAEDIPAIQDAIRRSRRGNGSTDCRIWKWLTTKGKVHGPAIELFVSKRWFTYTGHHVVDTPTEWRRVSAATVIDLIDRLGPAFLAADPSKRAPSLPLPPPNDDHSAATPLTSIDLATLEPGLRSRVEAAAKASGELLKRLRGDFSGEGITDLSGSGCKWNLGRAAYRAGLSEEDGYELMRAHPTTADSAEKEGQEGLEKVWESDWSIKPSHHDLSHVDVSAFESPGVLAALNRAQRRAVRSMIRRSRRDLANMPPFAWLYAGLIPARGIIFVVGAPKSHKTFIVLLFAVAAAAGAPFAGAASTSGPIRVAIWLGEGLGGLNARISAIEEHYGFEVGDRLDILTGAFSADAVIELFESDPPAVLIVDTLARSVASSNWDENSTRDMGLFIAELDRIREVLGCLIIVVHHLGKDANRGMRGATALLGAADGVFTVIKMAPGVSSFQSTELKEAETAPPLVFELRKQGDSAVAVLSSGAVSAGVVVPLAASKGPNEILALLTLKEAVADQTRHQNGLMPSTGGALAEDDEVPANAFFRGLPSVAAPLAAWRELFIARRAKPRRDMAIQAFDRAKASLIKKGLILVAGDWAQVGPAALPSKAQGVTSAFGSSVGEVET